MSDVAGIEFAKVIAIRADRSYISDNEKGHPGGEPMTRIMAAAMLTASGSALADDGSTATKQTANPRYEFRKEHDPNGTGKFYMGREIALVMGHEAADWLERPEREEEEKPGLLHKALGLKPGDVVADIGAGSGYHTFRLAKTVGDKGKVYAVEIQQEMIDLIDRKAKRQKRTNIETVMGTEADPKLPPNSCDLILLVDVYHEFSHPYEMTQAMVKALKPGGRIAFVEFRLEDSSVPIKLVHKMSQKQVIKEMSVHPLTWRTTLNVLPWQHLVIFEKAAAMKAAEGKP
jgi:precorrin-6B methylase 2